MKILRNAGFLLPVLIATTVSAVSVSAETVEQLPTSVCIQDARDLEKEVRRVPPAIISRDETGVSVYTINGNETWRRTAVEVKRGQKVEIFATGVVRWAPDGIEKIDVSPDGTRPPYRDGWNFYHFPYPDAGMGSLVMRIGKGVYPVGSSAVIQAEEGGFIEFMVNDDVLSDNSGYFQVKVK